MRHLLGLESLEETHSRLSINAFNNPPHDLATRWENAQAHRLTQALPPVPSPLALSDPYLTDTIVPAKAFQRIIANRHWQFARIPWNTLITPQPLAQWDYIEQWTDTLKDADILTVAFPAPPYSIEAYTAVSPDLDATLVTEDPNIHAAEVQWNYDSRLSLTVTFIKAPPFISVLKIKNRYIIKNGVHRILAMIRSGHQHIPCVLFDGNIQDIPALMNESLLDLDHPPRIGDFLVPELYLDIPWKNRMRVMRWRMDEFVFPGQF